jgi:enoyl-CoA hydratase
MSTVTVESDGPVRIVTIDRPEARNAVNPATAEALVEAFAAFDSDDGASVAILTGAGGNFCAGADLKALSQGDVRPVTEDGEGPMGPTRMVLGKPVIAAVEGYAVAGGLELAIWCDLRVMASDAVFGIFCRRFGVPLVDLGTIRLPRLIGHSNAMDMILTGRAVGADEALRMGLANRVSEPGAALGESVDLAHQIAAHPQTCMRNDRLSAIRQWDLTWEEATRAEVRGGLDTIASGDFATGAARFTSGEGRHGAF